MMPISDAASKFGSSQIITCLRAWCTNTQPQTVQQSEHIREWWQHYAVKCQHSRCILYPYKISKLALCSLTSQHCCGILQDFCIAIKRKYPCILVKGGQHPSPYGLHCPFIVLEGMGHAPGSLYLSVCDHQVHVLRGCCLELDKNIKATMVQWLQQ